MTPCRRPFLYLEELQLFYILGLVHLLWCLVHFKINWCGINPNSGRIFCIVWLLRLFNENFSSILSMVLRKEIGWWLIGLFYSFPSFGSITSEASFHSFGKYLILAQHLNIWQRKNFFSTVFEHAIGDFVWFKSTFVKKSAYCIL